MPLVDPKSLPNPATIVAETRSRIMASLMKLGSTQAKQATAAGQKAANANHQLSANPIATARLSARTAETAITLQRADAQLLAITSPQSSGPYTPLASDGNSSEIASNQVLTPQALQNAPQPQTVAPWPWIAPTGVNSITTEAEEISGIASAVPDHAHRQGSSTTTQGSATFIDRRQLIAIASALAALGAIVMLMISGG